MIIIILTRFPLTPDDLAPEDQAIFLHENDAAFELTDAARDALNEDDPNQDPPFIGRCQGCGAQVLHVGKAGCTRCADLNETPPY